MKCTHCGFENLDHAHKCMDCGQQLVEPQDVLPPPAPLAAEDMAELRQSMSTVALADLPRMDVGEVFGQIVSVYFANFASFFLITALANIPGFAIGFFYMSIDPEELVTSGAFIWLTLLTILVSLLVSALATGALTYGVLQHMRKRPVDIGECVRTGFSVLGAVVVVALMQSIIIGLGSLLCLVPGIIAAVMFIVAVPVAVEERPGASAALDRSKFLTTGYRWQIFFVLVLIGIFHVAASLLIGMFGNIIGSPAVAQIIQMIEGVLYAGISATAGALIYYRLRCYKEAVNIEELASVFD